MRSLILLIVVLSGAAAHAGNITLVTPVDSGFASYQQNSQNPCVIGDNPCGPHPPIPFTTIGGGGNINSYDVYSPTYTVGQLTGVLNSSYFVMGLDLNNNSNPQTIQLVAMEVNHNNGGFQQVQFWDGDLSVKAANNGSGYSDLLFKMFSLINFNSSDLVQFHLVMNSVNPGAESLFLLSSDGDGIIILNDVPEPSTALLLGGALACLGIYRRRRS